MIEYRGVFQFEADRDTLWQAVSAIESFPHWAPWLHDLEREGDWPEAGTVITFDVVSPLPYRISLLVELTDVAQHEFIEARVDRDLSGHGRLAARPTDRGTEVELSWSLTPRARILQTLLRVSGPFVRWTQDWAVRAAVAGVKRKLRDHPA